MNENEDGVSKETLERKLRQVQALLDRAEHPNTPEPEAVASRAKAEELMRKYRIEEEHLRQTALATGTGDLMKPMMDEFPICDYSSQYKDQYTSLFYAIVYHVGNIKAAYKYLNGAQTAYMVGFESDLRYAQTLYTSMRLHFANTLEPTVDRDLSDEENVYRLRSAGLEREKIRQMIWGGARGGNIIAMYKKACEERGENPAVVGNANAKTYRHSFADAYVSRVNSRLWNMRNTAGVDSAALELAGRKEYVDEAFYEAFPHLRPITREDRMLGESDITGGPGGNCPKCKKAKSGYCRDHNWLKPRQYNERPVSSAGMAAGRRAADSADLGRSGKGRIDS